MSKLLTLLFVVPATLVIVSGQASSAEAVTYLGDWRMTIHRMAEETDHCYDGVCGTSFDVRTNQPAWEGSNQYDVEMILDGQALSNNVGAGQNEYWHVDRGFGGVRATGQTDTPLAAGVHTLTLNWFYRGVWTCGADVPNGCSYVGREHVTKTYKFRWYGGADQTVRPYRAPSSSVTVGARRSTAEVTVSGTVRAQRLNADYVLSSTYYPVRSARATLQSYSATKRSWVSRTTVYSTRRGKVAVTVKAPRVTKWRWVVSPKNAYRGSTSKTVKR